MLKMNRISVSLHFLYNYDADEFSNATCLMQAVTKTNTEGMEYLYV